MLQDSLHQHHCTDNEASHKPVHQWLKRAETIYHQAGVNAVVQRWENADELIECTEK
jgi:hypothetical protein